MKPVIETHDLCKSYNGRTVVDHLNLTVPQGCVYGFLGPNGAGKSTSMKMLLGLVHPTGGITFSCSAEAVRVRQSPCCGRPEA